MLDKIPAESEIAESVCRLILGATWLAFPGQCCPAHHLVFRRNCTGHRTTQNCSDQKTKSKTSQNCMGLSHSWRHLLGLSTSLACHVTLDFNGSPPSKKSSLGSLSSQKAPKTNFKNIRPACQRNHSLCHVLGLPSTLLGTHYMQT